MIKPQYNYYVNCFYTAGSDEWTTQHKHLHLKVDIGRSICQGRQR